MSSYNARGLVSDEAHFDAMGRPALVADGFHRVRYQYDALGYRTEQAYFDTADRPVNHRNGYQRLLETTDRFGKTIKRAYFDATGRPTTNREGSRVVANLFERCDFLLGKDVAVIVVPADLPEGDLIVYINRTRLSFVEGTRVLADIPYKDPEGRIYRYYFSERTGRHR